MKFKQCELKFHPRHGFSVARSFWQRCDRSRTLLKFYSEPPSPRLNSIAQILPSAKAEDEPPPLCLNSAAPTDRRPARDRLRANYRTDRQQAGHKPAARRSKRSSKTYENGRRQTCRQTKGSPKQMDRRSTRSVVSLVSKPLGTLNEQADQQSEP